MKVYVLTATHSDYEDHDFWVVAVTDSREKAEARRDAALARQRELNTQRPVFPYREVRHLPLYQPHPLIQKFEKDNEAWRELNNEPANACPHRDFDDIEIVEMEVT